MVLDGTRRALYQSSLPVAFWTYVVACWCFIYNNTAFDNLKTRKFGGCPYQRKHGRKSKARQIPPGAKIHFRLPTPLLKKLPKLGQRAIPGIMLGYALKPGGMWTGDYIVTTVSDWHARKTGNKRVRIFRVKEVHFDHN